MGFTDTSWKLADQKTQKTLWSSNPEDSIEHIVLSKNDQYLAYVHGRELVTCNLKNGTSNFKSLLDHDKNVKTLAFSNANVLTFLTNKKCHVFKERCRGYLIHQTLQMLVGNEKLADVIIK